MGNLGSVKQLTVEAENILADFLADRNLKNRFLPEFQELYVRIWRNLDSHARIFSERTIEEALDRAKGIGSTTDGIQALITGSLHLVSGALCLLEPGSCTHYIS